MAQLIEPCSFQEWKLAVERYPVDLLNPAEIQLYANTFYSTQFIGKEIFEKVQPQAYRIIQGGNVAGWTLLYKISDSKIRARGTVINPDLRKQGLGKELLLEACRLYPQDYKTVVSFALESKLDFYIKSGFQVVSSFEPRSAELYSPQDQGYNLNSEVKLYLVERERP